LKATQFALNKKLLHGFKNVAKDVMNRNG
jgi:hypothetical protein